MNTSFEVILPFLRPIEALIKDPHVSEIMVNPDSRIFVEREGEVTEVPGVTIGEKNLQVAVRNIARALGDEISEEKPLLDSRLPDGSRVAAAIPPCSVGGTTLTIRKFESRYFTADELVRVGLRHRPDRIILGEVRGGEAFDLLQALNTGHSGTLSTIHANSARGALGRLTSCVLQSGVELPYAAIRMAVAESIGFLVHLERRRNRRVVVEVVGIAGYDHGTGQYRLETIFPRNRHEEGSSEG